MAIIALLTDFGERDEYVGVVKGVILNINPQAKIIDLSHEIPPQDIVWASYLLYGCYKFFPKNTIFLSVVDPGVGTKRKIIVVKTKEYIFVSPDNGLLTKVLEREKPEKIIEVKNKKFFLKEISSTFHARDIIAPVVGYLSKGVNLGKFGLEVKKVKMISLPKPLIRNNQIIGEIIYVDRFGNLVTNIEKKILKRKKSHFCINIKGRKIYKINNSYAESKKGKLLAIWGSRDLLELAVNQGSASRELKIKKGERVHIEFSYSL